MDINQIQTFVSEINPELNVLEFNQVNNIIHLKTEEPDGMITVWELKLEHKGYARSPEKGNFETE
jgi:hypothetical protein